MKRHDAVSSQDNHPSPADDRDRLQLTNRLQLLRTDQGQDLVRRLIVLAQRGLPKMYISGGFAHTTRVVSHDGKSTLRQEGQNLRYAAIVALGAHHVDEASQRQIFHGANAAEFALALIKHADDCQDIGGLALVAWAAAEVAGHVDEEIFSQIRMFLLASHPISTVECSWVLTAALAARGLSKTDDISLMAAERLKNAQVRNGLFPHMLPSNAAGTSRAHVSCFADQVYPIQALARFYVSFGDEGALVAANACASHICELQGSDGQWWWHYDTRIGGLVEGYPVYSVHQHAMAPMALLDLYEAEGSDFRKEVEKGLRWLCDHPEVSSELISEECSVVWRKVGRREPRKVVRSISALATAIKPGVKLSGLKTLFPPTKIDYECRPYELGWLLYAWLSSGVVKNLCRDEKPQALESLRSHWKQPDAQSLFGFSVAPLRMEDVMERCRKAIMERQCLLLGVLNAAKVVNSRKDPALLASLLQCDILLADGQSIVWASRLLRRPLPERVAGIDLFENLLRLAHREKLSIYLLGARPDVLAKLRSKLLSEYTDLKVVGCQDGYFAEEDSVRIAEDIQRSGADMLFLGMSSPKKEKFLAAFKDTLTVPVLHGVGGSFDIIAGMTKRAPVSWQRVGMEWSFRLMQEPRRMWRRYLSTNTKFLGLFVREFVSAYLRFRSGRTALRPSKVQSGN